jgi:hypothetical protein
VCDAACDADCATCCQPWSARAVCASGEAVAETGSYATAHEAAAFAASAGSARPERCSDGTAPRWQAYCAPENAFASPIEPASVARLVALRASLGLRLRDVREAQSALFAFADEHLLTVPGQGRIGEAAAGLRRARASLVDAMATAAQLRARADVALPDVDALDAKTADVRERADVAVGKARGVVGDASVVDFAAEAKEKKIPEATVAAQAREAAEKARIEEAKREVAEADRRRRAALDEVERERRAKALDEDLRRQVGREKGHDRAGAP